MFVLFSFASTAFWCVQSSERFPREDAKPVLFEFQIGFGRLSCADAVKTGSSREGL